MYYTYVQYKLGISFNIDFIQHIETSGFSISNEAHFFLERSANDRCPNVNVLIPTASCGPYMPTVHNCQNSYKQIKLNTICNFFDIWRAWTWC